MSLNKLLLAAIVGVMALAGGQANAGEPLRIGVEGAYPPFSWKEADGSMKGFDIDMAYALCEKMDRECTLIEQEWDGMIPALIARKFDAIVASMSITEDRKKRVDFTIKYYASPLNFLAKKGSNIDTSPEGLAGKRIGFQRATTHQCYAEKHLQQSEHVLYTTVEDVYADLIAGRIDLMSADSLAAMEGFLNTDAGKDYEFIGAALDDVACIGEGEGITIRKGDPLREEFTAAILAVRADGTYQKINAKYFPIDIYGK